LKSSGKSSRLTTKPGVSGTSTAVLPSRSQSASLRTRVSSLATAGKTSSTSGIRSTGLKTWIPANRSGRPLAAASSSIDRDDVVVPRIVLPFTSPASRPSTSRFTAASSTTASTTYVQRASSSTLVVTVTPSPSSARASAAASSRRAHRTTAPCSAATRANPLAMAPLPAMPRRSVTFG
jgi:hypothetical protein